MESKFKGRATIMASNQKYLINKPIQKLSFDQYNIPHKLNNRIYIQAKIDISNMAIKKYPFNNKMIKIAFVKLHTS